VLEPDLRTNNGAHDFAQHLLTKAAERLRRGDYYCRRLGVHLSWVADLGGWWDETDFHETRDTGFLLARQQSAGVSDREGEGDDEEPGPSVTMVEAEEDRALPGA